jgi:hypothetical protein
MLPHVTWLRTSPSLSDELRCHRVLHNSRPPLFARGALVPTCVLWPSNGLWAMRIKNNPGYAARVARYRGMHVCYQGT